MTGRPAWTTVASAADDPITLYGLPMAPIADRGTVLVLRAQRAILQKWLIETPWADAGRVTIANGGEIAKAAGLLDHVYGPRPFAGSPGPGSPPTPFPPSDDLRPPVAATPAPVPWPTPITFSPPRTPEPNPTGYGLPPDWPPHAPTLDLIIDANRLTSRRGSSCWRSPTTAYCGDGPPLRTTASLPARRDSVVRFEFNGPAADELRVTIFAEPLDALPRAGDRPVRVLHFQPGDRLEWPIDLPPGAYRWHAFARWHGVGDASYAFHVTVATDYSSSQDD